MFPRQRVQDPEQYHRIHPAGNRYQNALPRPDEPMHENALLNMIQQFAHGGMLFPKPSEARRIAPSVTKLIGADASHAWAAFFCLGLGWIDIDPTNNPLPSMQHITLGWGRDYGDVSPHPRRAGRRRRACPNCCR